jgi:hypothetical protein
MMSGLKVLLQDWVHPLLNPGTPINPLDVARSMITLRNLMFKKVSRTMAKVLISTGNNKLSFKILNLLVQLILITNITNHTITTTANIKEDHTHMAIMVTLTVTAILVLKEELEEDLLILSHRAVHRQLHLMPTLISKPSSLNHLSAVAVEVEKHGTKDLKTHPLIHQPTPQLQLRPLQPQHHKHLYLSRPHPHKIPLKPNNPELNPKI